jgi:hypothetical protein
MFKQTEPPLWLRLVEAGARISSRRFDSSNDELSFGVVRQCAIRRQDGTPRSNGFHDMVGDKMGDVKK